MADRKSFDEYRSDDERLRRLDQVHPRATSPDLSIFPEGIGETLSKFGRALGIGVDRKGVLPGEGSDIVYAMHMVSMRVGEEEGIDRRDASPQCLKPEFRTGIDDKGRSTLLHEERCPETPVSGVGRTADGTAAGDDGYSVARAGAEDGEVHSAVQ